MISIKNEKNDKLMACYFYLSNFWYEIHYIQSQGDSGGPLTVLNESKQHLLVGKFLELHGKICNNFSVGL